MNDYYDRREQMKEILKTQGGKDFFKELNAAGIPFLFIAATANTENKTEYFCESITPNAMGICLTDDKFADLLNIRNHGFVAVPEFSLVSANAEGMGQGEKPDDKNDDIVPAAKGRRTGSANNRKNDDVTDLDILDAVIKSVILQQPSGQEPFAGDMLPSGLASTFCSEELQIIWDTNTDLHKSREEDYLEIEEQRRNILKGDGSFPREKKQNSSHHNITRQQPQRE